MALPSQTGRSNNYRRSYMFRRRRLPRVPVYLAGAVIILGLGWIALSAIRGGERATRDELAAHDPDITMDSTQSPPPLLINTTSTRPGDVASAANAASRESRNTTATPPQESRRTADTPPSVEERNDPAPRRQQEPQRTETPRPQDESRTARPPQNNPTQRPGTTSSAAARALQHVQQATEAMNRNSPLEARRHFSAAMFTGALPPEDERSVIRRMQSISEALVFGPVIHPDDPFALSYRVKSGDILQRIARSNGLLTEWQFIARINGISDPRRIQRDQTLKLITGPFHAVVHKSKYRLDLYLGEGERMVYVRSFDVGLGEYNSTPPGRFIVGVKAQDPEWINPRTRERFRSGDPQNPIGRHWLELRGIDENTQDFTGYGIHGTIEPQSIGQQASMGCIRMLPDDVAMIYEVLMSDVSVVEIRD